MSSRHALHAADRRVAEGEQRIAKQERVLDDLRRRGLPTDLAHDTLEAVRTTHQLVVEDRRAIKGSVDRRRRDGT